MGIVLGKLILWLSGLLLAIVTMNITVYLALTGVYLAGRAIGRFKRDRKALREAAAPAGDDESAGTDPARPDTGSRGD